MAKPPYRFNHGYWIIPLIVLSLTLGLLLVLLVRWLQGGEFRSLVELKTTERLHAKAVLAPIRWGWTELSSDSLRALGSAGTVLKRIESTGVHAKLHPAALFQGQLVVEEIALDHIEIHVGPVTEFKNEMIETVAEKPYGLPKWIPTQFEVRRIRSGTADVLIEQPRGASFDILGTSLESIPEGNEIRFEAHGGRLVSERFPDQKIGIETIRCRLSNLGLDLTGADLSFQGGGSLRLEGIFPSDGTEARLKGHWDKVNLASLMPTLEGHVLGTLEGQGEAAWGRDGIHALSGTVGAHDVTLTDIPALEKLALCTGMDQFRHLPVQEAHATFSGDAEKTLWRDIVIESKGMLMITGEAQVSKEGALQGSFQVGITKGIVAILPFAREALGLSEHDGLIWMPMKVEGSLTHPKEDLTPRLATVITARAEGMVKEGIQEGLHLLGIKLPDVAPGATNAPTTNPVKSLEQDAGKVLDTLGGFLK